ncbi:topoisomerase 1b [Yasminevirus sp. GU-2018]|uniref:DNA topoisomerase 1 n=1 Tax=Yasminevirus sp. GU-2018 TaxID=2420051 RepID=A0A5K0UB60_9VIRU|nr:topoisomerase 1b [Yasminevirus sp. GU-2018]
MSTREYELYIKTKTDYISLMIESGTAPGYINYIMTKGLVSDIIRSNPQGGQTGGAVTKKWTELQHNGVMFYPEYEPHEVQMKYGSGAEKVPITLNPEAEEFITYYVQARFDKYRSDKFNRNFFNDWKKLLSPELRKKITDFSLCDFSDIKAHVEKDSERKKEERKAMSKEEREEEKKKSDAEKDLYRYAMVDGTKQMIDNFLVEPPTIFVGRGDHPLSGSIKKRLYPEDLTLNIGKGMAIPVPKLVGKGKDEDGSVTAKEKWGAIISDNTLEWIASWQNNVTQKYNYARFGRKSGFKMKSDENKYDKARLLKKKINKIREKNEVNMGSKDLETRQLATALYLIDRLALRIGNEKKEDEADTVGVTTLKIKNVHLMDNDTIKLDFLGKDSIRYVNKFKVPPIVYNNIKDFHDDPEKGNNDDLFDLINSDSLNKYIKRFMKKLTSKVFRTFNASYLMQIELKKIANKYKDYDKPDKLTKIHHEYEMANLKVAKLCNHQKEASKSTGEKIEKTQQKLADLQTKLRKFKREKAKKIEKGTKTVAINKRIATLQAKIKEVKSKKSLQTESKTLSTGTSKINYIDPRITIAFLKTTNLFDNIDKFFNKTHQRQFEWAMEVDSDFKF